jgi:hypothetical protein
MDTTEDIQMQLYNSRLRLRNEMRRAIQCISPASKRKLAKEWKDKYSDIFYNELINCAKKKEVALHLANWNLEHDKKEINGSGRHSHKR